MGVLLIALTLGFAGEGQAAEEASAENKAAARDLATSGIQLAQAGQCEDAISKLTRAEKLYHAPTILTWIGQCQIQLGRLVEGTETLNRVVREQLDEGSPDAYKDAQARARQLILEARPKIGKLTIEVTPTEVEGLEVLVNDRPMSVALVGAPRPTDPGEQTVTVSAPGYRSVTQEVKLAEGAQETLRFVLEKNASMTSTPDHPAKADDQADSSPTRTNWAGWTTVGVGGAFLAAGGVTGLLALGKEKDLSSACSDGECPESSRGTLKSARTTATLSTVFFGVGGAAVVTGVVLLVTGKRSQKERTGAHFQPQIGLGSVGLSGTF